MTVAGDAKATYEAMAPVYDIFTADYDDELWIGGLVSALEGNGLSGERLLDVACGTGKSFLPMLDRGWSVTACDISPAMVERSRAKVGGAVSLSVADMRSLPTSASSISSGCWTIRSITCSARTNCSRPWPG